MRFHVLALGLLNGLGMRFVSPLLLTLGLVACAPVLSEQRSYEILVRVESDPGEPMPNVTLDQGGKKLGTTDASGVVKVRIVGHEGERATLRATCPETHITPEEPVAIVLRTYIGTHVPEVGVRCPPRERKLAVVVRVKNGANLDLVHRNKTIGHTDESGVAHLLLEGPPGHAFEVNLDTSKREELRPQNPGTRFVIATRDEAVLFDPELEIEKQVVREPRRKKQRGPDLPQRITRTR